MSEQEVTARIERSAVGKKGWGWLYAMECHALTEIADCRCGSDDMNIFSEDHYVTQLVECYGCKCRVSGEPFSTEIARSIASAVVKWNQSQAQ